MRDNEDKRRRKRSGEREIEDALAQSMPSYTPQHRRAILKGLRILARVAIRSYMEEKAEAASRPGATKDDGGEEGQRGM